jgi:hypothetical protein
MRIWTDDQLTVPWMDGCVQDKLYAIVRAAQLGGVKQFLVSEDKPEKKKAANKKRKATEAPM